MNLKPVHGDRHGGQGFSSLRFLKGLLTASEASKAPKTFKASKAPNGCEGTRSLEAREAPRLLWPMVLEALKEPKAPKALKP